MKKWFKRVAIFIVVLVLLFVIYLFLVFYMFTKMDEVDKNYEIFCSQHIPLLDNYYVNNGAYPVTLNMLDRQNLNKKYIDKDCGYTTGEKGYSFHISHGLGVAGYSSIDKKWWYD